MYPLISAKLDTPYLLQADRCTWSLQTLSWCSGCELQRCCYLHIQQHIWILQWISQVHPSFQSETMHLLLVQPRLSSAQTYISLIDLRFTFHEWQSLCALALADKSRSMLPHARAVQCTKHFRAFGLCKLLNFLTNARMFAMGNEN